MAVGREVIPCGPDTPAASRHTLPVQQKMPHTCWSVNTQRTVFRPREASPWENLKPCHMIKSSKGAAFTSFETSFGHRSLFWVKPYQKAKIQNRRGGGWVGLRGWCGGGGGSHLGWVSPPLLRPSWHKAGGVLRGTGTNAKWPPSPRVEAPRGDSSDPGDRESVGKPEGELQLLSSRWCVRLRGRGTVCRNLKGCSREEISLLAPHKGELRTPLVEESGNDREVDFR